MLLTHLLWMPTLGWGAIQDHGDPPPRPPTWAEVGPIFAEHCTHCHGGDRPTRGLGLESREQVMKGSRAGPVADAGDPGASELILRLRGDSEPRMPLDGPPFLDDEQVRLVEDWIRAGLPDAPPIEVPPGPGPKPQPGPKTGPGEDPPRSEPPPPVTWREVAPLFARNCVRCHKNGGLRGRAPEGLELISLPHMLRGGERTALVPGAPDASEILRRMRGESRPRMPLDGPPYLTADEIGLVEQWIRDGARDSTGKPSPVDEGREVRYRGRLTGYWQIDGLRVVVDGRTRIDKRPRVGDRAEVRGVVLPDGRILATRIRRR